MDIIQIPTTQTPGAGLGDVVGPASSTDNAIVRYDATTGRLLQNSTVTIADSTGAIAGASSLTSPASTNLTLAGGAGNSSIILTPAGTGNVGIGTTSPSDKFVVSNAGAEGLEIGATSLIIAQAYNRSGSAYVDYRDQCLNRIFYTNGSTEAMRIASTGVVSISNTTAGSSGAGALVVQGGISAGNTGSAASYFGGAVTVGGNLTLPAASAGYRLILAGTSNTGTGQLVIQAGGGSAAWGGTLNLFETAHASKGGYVGVGLGVSGAKFTINSSGFSDSGEVASIDRSGNATFAGAVAIGNTVNSVSPTSPNRTITMVVGGVTLYIAAKTTND